MNVRLCRTRGRLRDARKLAKAKAFTLIELLVAIGIIATLAGLLVPALARTKARACSIKCKGNLRQIDLALQMYVTETHAYPLEEPVLPFENAGKAWYRYLEPLLNSNWTNDVFRCPSYRGNLVGREPGTGRIVGCYGYNDWGIGMGTAPANPFGLGLAGVQFQNLPVPESEVRVPSDMVGIGDNFMAYDTHIIAENFRFGRWYSPQPQVRDAVKAAHTRHYGTLNVGFCDGHVSSLKTDRLFGPKDEDRRIWNIDHLPHR